MRLVCVAIPGLVLEIVSADGVLTGAVEVDGQRRTASFAFLPDVVVGEYVVLHSGYAVARLDETDALVTLDLINGRVGE
ncbi:HypC/HybG/HupF family hydrogenase formation chaperone [Kribbella sindirgiensis]|uniref:HypC/HybG/HupF family hydrogenase formation chaperone n=1 Tax=Kribbella sindirgiensis TaxID=1124744 RepID=UPI0013F43D3C|nr:HypC/HybG/HupF family hydrogenase formation chaperone [Kribbella sindirgiensis]